MMNNIDPFTINYDKIINYTGYCSATRLLAAQLRGNSMMLVSKFFKELSDNELEELRELSEQSEIDDVCLSEIMLITLMLTSAEGTSALTEEELMGQLTTTKIFISTAFLHRQGLVTADFDSFSYGSDMEDRVIAVPTDTGIEFSKKFRGGLDDE